MPHAPRILALDTASPVVSIALADPESVLASRALEQVQSSKRLLPLLAEILAEAGVELDAIDGLVALRGPGSFTGLRVGLATALGLHQALDLPATAVPTFEALAAASGLEGGGLGPDDGRDAVVAVDVLRGEWVVQRFTSAALPQPLDEPRRLPASELATLAPCRLIGFGADSLGEIPGVELLVPPPLAPALALDAARRPPRWSAELLTEPLYYRPPAVSVPKRKPGQPRR